MSFAFNGNALRQRFSGRERMQCLILVGGLGTRMAEFCSDIPKALLPIGTKTFLEWQLEWLALGGVTEVVLALGHQGELIQEHLARSTNQGRFPKLRFSFDGDTLLGTGGAIRKASSMLDDDFLVTYGDSFLFVRPENLLQKHQANKQTVTFSLFRNDDNFDSSNVEFRDDQIVVYDKRKKTDLMHHIDYGMFAVNRDGFLQMCPDGPFDVADLLHTCSVSKQMAPYLVDRRFYEIGSPAGYEAFCKFLKDEEYRLRNCLRHLEHKLPPLQIQEDLLHVSQIYSRTSNPAPSVLIIIPGSVSYFYDVEGTRFARSLEALGANTEVLALSQTPTRKDYDWVLFFNLSEIELAAQENPSGLQTDFFHAVQERKQRAKHSALVLLESVRVSWFHQNIALFQKAGLDHIFDIGFLDQKEFCAKDVAPLYTFFFNGLTQYERESARSHWSAARDRPLPWSFIGHRTRERIQFVGDLIQRLGPQGFLYLPEFTPITKDGPHLNEAKFEKVLQKTRLKIWCSHVPSFYMESIRFRYALLNGAIPIKVNFHPQDYDRVPFNSLVFESQQFPTNLSDEEFEETREHFLEEFLALPSFETTLRESILFRDSFTEGSKEH